MEVHMDDVHGFGPGQQVQKFKEDLAAHIWFRDGGVHHDGAEYDHLKRFRKKLNRAVTIESNPKYLDAVLELLGLEGAKDVPTPSVPGHKEKLITGEPLNSSETTVTGSVLEVCSTTHRTEQTRSTKCQSWIQSWEANSGLDDRSETCGSLLERNERLCQQACVEQ